MSNDTPTKSNPNPASLRQLAFCQAAIDEQRGKYKGRYLARYYADTIRKQSARDSREQAMLLAAYGLKITGIGQ